MKITVIVLILCVASHSFAAGKKVAKKTDVEKVPKSMFLIKKAKIHAGVGEPQYYPAEAQLRTLSHDSLLHNTKKFE